MERGGRPEAQAGEGGTLIVAAAPIGRPEDVSPRLARALAEAPVVAAEDTRRVRRLASALGVRLAGTVVSYYDDIESRRVPALLAQLRGGRDVLLLTDAGMPAISDPGYRLVAAAAADGLRVTALPGPSAVTAALAVSGLPSDRFCFEGFAPRRAGERARRFAELAAERRTLIFFESPRRLAGTLGALAGALGGARRAVVCRELTKTHEEVLRGTLAELAARAQDHPLGEITVVVEGAPAGAATTAMAEAVARVADRELAGSSRRDAIAAVAKESGLRRREVYDAVVRAVPLG
ncbi:MAG TPA: 16S rRNA (cytidine(1402)-2'-O)-methyltransferase [Streptosporangiaceae bacterium]|nr:16S rRNA (cytidine(1402)-2'-O)-methyltransferase [Streptosporangiaceae bacterium]